MATPAWISLGSNIGDRRGILDAALAALAETPGVVVQAVSPYHETQAIGGPPGQGPFLNAAARLDTDLDPHQLLAALQGIENQAGRLRTVRWGERTLDLDLLFFGHQFVHSEGLTVPHPRLAVRRFVLAPLAEIAPTFVDPVSGRMIANLLANLDRKPRLIAIFGWHGGQREAIFGRLVEELPGFGISDADLGMPDVATADDPSRANYEGIERKAEALKTSRWAVETLRVPWIVTDYSLDIDIFWATIVHEYSKGRTSPKPRPQSEAQVEWVRRIKDLSRFALPTTFVLCQSSNRDLRRSLPITLPPILRPESEEPDAIVAEVLATCRGIEGV